jgi:hypothetical protein
MAMEKTCPGCAALETRVLNLRRKVRNLQTKADALDRIEKAIALGAELVLSASSDMGGGSCEITPVAYNGATNVYNIIGEMSFPEHLVDALARYCAHCSKGPLKQMVDGNEGLVYCSKKCLRAGPNDE